VYAQPASVSATAVAPEWSCWQPKVLYRFEKVLGRHGIVFPRQTLGRWVIQGGEHLQPLLNLMRDQLLESRVIHCDETRAQLLKEQDQEPTSQSWMWAQTGGPSDKPVILFDYSTRA